MQIDEIVNQNVDLQKCFSLSKVFYKIEKNIGIKNIGMFLEIQKYSVDGTLHAKIHNM